MKAEVCRPHADVGQVAFSSAEGPSPSALAQLGPRRPRPHKLWQKRFVKLLVVGDAGLVCPWHSCNSGTTVFPVDIDAYINLDITLQALCFAKLRSFDHLEHAIDCKHS